MGGSGGKGWEWPRWYFEVPARARPWFPCLRPADGRLPVLVTRGPRRDEDLAEVVAAHLGLPLAAHLPDVPRFPVDEAAGRWPGTAGPLARVADRVLDAVVEPGHRAVAS